MKLKLFQSQFCDKVMQEFLEFMGHEMKLCSDVFQSFKRQGKLGCILFQLYRYSKVQRVALLS